MLKASELRIGNKVFFGGVVITITADFLYYKKNEDSACYPIPLTQEILEKCGFEFNGSDYWYVNTFPLEWNGYTIYLVGQGNLTDEPAKVQIQSLHQLQNLYYALTGEELSITL